MRKLMGLWVGVVLLTGCGGTFPGVEDGFETMRIARGPGVDWALTENGVIDVTVARDGAAMVLSGTRALRGDPATDTCLLGARLGAETGSCVVESPVERTLDAGEVERLRSLSSEIPGKGCFENPMLECDPPLIRRIEVDGRSEDDYCCGDKAEDFSPAVDALFAYVDGLAAG